MTKLQKTSADNVAVATILDRRDQIEIALDPFPMQVDSFLRSAMTAISSNPSLGDPQRTAPITVYASVLQAAQVGLSLDRFLGYGALVPYRPPGSNVAVCQWQPMFQGLLELARRSGQVKKVECRAVFDGDTFDYQFGDQPFIRHVPNGPNLDIDSKLTHTYAIAWLTTGDVQFEVCTRAFIDRIKKSSKAAKKSGSPWHEWYVQQAKKTAVKQLCKWLPRTQGLVEALAADDAAEIEETPRTPEYATVTPDPGSPLDVMREELEERDAANEVEPVDPERDHVQPTPNVEPMNRTEPVKKKNPGRPPKPATDEQIEKVIAALNSREADWNEVASWVANEIGIDPVQAVQSGRIPLLSGIPSKIATKLLKEIKNGNLAIQEAPVPDFDTALESVEEYPDAEDSHS